MSFGMTIRTLRTEASKTLKEVADALDLRLTRLSDIEHGRRGPFNAEKIRKFTEFLGISECEKELIQLAASDTESIEIKTSKSSSKFNEVAFALARKSSLDFDEVSDDTWDEILKLLDKKK